MKHHSYLENLFNQTHNYIYNFNGLKSIVLTELVVYNDAAFSYKLILEHKRTDDKITVRSSNLYAQENQLFNHHELNGITFNSENWRLILQTDLLYGDGNFELKFATNT